MRSETIRALLLTASSISMIQSKISCRTYTFSTATTPTVFIVSYAIKCVVILLLFESVINLINFRKLYYLFFIESAEILSLSPFSFSAEVSIFFED